MLHSSESYSGDLQKNSAVYHRSAFKMISGFHTVFTEAAVAISGMLPIEILANKRQSVY